MRCNPRAKRLSQRTPADVQRYVAEYVEQQKAAKGEKDARRKKRGPDGRKMRLRAKELDDHSTFFSATFLNEAVETVVLADPGADENILPPYVLEMIFKADPNVKVEPLRHPLKFSLAVENFSSGKSVKVICSRQVTADMYLRIRQGSELIMPGMRWVVSHQDAE